MNQRITHEFYNKITEQSKYIRTEVFVKEQGFTEEFDELDNKVLHVIIFVNQKAVATARLIKDDQVTYHIGRVAVLKDYRRLHLGNMLLELLEDKAKELGAKKIQLSAQLRVKEFYEKAGYVASGEVYLDEYCEHIHMEKEI